jgi:hypothetical protein
MIKIKPILYGEFIDVNVYSSAEWIDGVLTQGTLQSVGSAIVMPWNTNKDKEYIQAGSYTVDDRKAYSYDKLHESSEVREVVIGGVYYKLQYIKEYNESSGYFYGLKKFEKVV